MQGNGEKQPVQVLAINRFHLGVVTAMITRSLSGLRTAFGSGSVRGSSSRRNRWEGKKAVPVDRAAHQ